MPDAATVLAKDARKPILYLRPFKDDDESSGASMPFFSHPKTREARLVRSLKHLGPVIAFRVRSPHLHSGYRQAWQVVERTKYFITQ
jgi:hypothetical protein